MVPTATSEDARRHRRRVAVLPVGSFEQHGPCLPLTTDTIVAHAVAERICRDHGLFLLPPVAISCSHEHAGFAGTLSIGPTTLHAVVSDVWHSLERDGWTGLVVVNGHGGNYVLSNLAQQLNQDGPKVLLFPTAGDMRAAARDADLETAAGDTDMHAGEFEVSLLLHVDPRLVLPGYEDTDWETLEWRSGLLVRGMKAFAPGGVIGRPSAGSAEKGRRVLDALSVSFGERLAYLRAAAAGADRDA